MPEEDSEHDEDSAEGGIVASPEGLVNVCSEVPVGSGKRVVSKAVSPEEVDVPPTGMVTMGVHDLEIPML